MNNSPHIAMTSSIRGQEVRHAERPGRRDAGKSDNGGDHADAAFGMMMGQLISVTGQDAPHASEGKENPETVTSEPRTMPQEIGPDPAVDTAEAQNAIPASDSREETPENPQMENDFSPLSAAVYDKVIDVAIVDPETADNVAAAGTPVDRSHQNDALTTAGTTDAPLQETKDGEEGMKPPALPEDAVRKNGEEGVSADNDFRIDQGKTGDLKTDSAAMKKTDGPQPQSEPALSGDPGRNGLADNPEAPDHQATGDKNFSWKSEQGQSKNAEDSSQPDDAVFFMKPANIEDRQRDAAKHNVPAGAEVATLARNEPQAAAVGFPNSAEGGTRQTTAADPAELFDHAATIVKDGNRLAVQMEHDGLGKLNIDLRMHKGMVQAMFQVADNAAKNMIEQNMQRIMNTLLEAGLSVGGFSVSLNQRGAGYETAQHERNYSHGISGFDPQATGAPLSSTAQGLVNIFA